MPLSCPRGRTRHDGLLPGAKGRYPLVVGEGNQEVTDMVGRLGAAGGRRTRMLSEMAKADLGRPDRALRSLSYGASRSVVTPGAYRPPTDDRHLVLEKWVQAALNVALGLSLKLDGVLKGETRIALKRFQREMGLTAHGFVDESTLQALELRVGVRAPRGQSHEGLPRLLREPQQRRAPRRPPPDDRPKSRAGIASSSAEEDQAGPTTDPRWRLDEVQTEAVRQVLEREAVETVVYRAFERSWVRDELTRLGRSGEAALAAEMRAFYDRAVAVATGVAVSTGWLSEVRTAASAEPERAVEVLRQAWRDAHR